MERTKIKWQFASQDLHVRLRPLRENWEARGPGMLAFAVKQAPWLSLPSEVSVRLVEPKRGGGRLVDGQIEFQAVLANPYPMLPEVVRLAWLILCHSASAGVSFDNRTMRLGLIPLTIAAAEFVDLARVDETTVGVALQAWNDSNVFPASVNASELIKWWASSQPAVFSESAWQTALTHL